METARAAEVLRVAGNLIEAVREAKADPYADLKDAARRGLPTTGYRRVEQDMTAEVDAAMERFVGQVTALFERFRAGTLPAERLLPEVREAYIRQARKMLRAGKRSMGSPEVLTLEDEGDIADAVDRAGLEPGSVRGKQTLGAILTRAISLPPLDEDQRSMLARSEVAMGRYVDGLVGRVMPGASPRKVARQQALARKRIERQMSDGRRRILSGRLTVDALVLVLLAALALEARRAGRAAPEPITLPQLEAAEQAAEEEVRQESGGRFGIGTLVMLLVIAPAVWDSRVMRWFTGRVERSSNSLWAVAQAGQKAAFRDGTPAPPPDAEGTLPGAGQPRPEPQPLERRVIAWWVIDPEAENCIDCIRLRDMNPYYLDGLQRRGIHPGSHHTRCWDNCRCRLVYDVPQFEGVALAV